MAIEIQFTLNGEPITLVVQTHQLLLDALRDQMHLTSVKEGCGTGDCGACTVLLDEESICSCLVLAAEIDGRHVETVDGLASDDNLHPLQRAFISEGGLQCGFCTPGMLLSAKALLHQNCEPDEQEIRHALAGNLCRCTGYDRIVRAVQAAAAEMKRDE